MSGRRKLNQSYIQGSLLLAGIAGGACESWFVFWMAALILVGLNLYSGEIRPRAPRSPDRKRRRARPPDDRL